VKLSVVPARLLPVVELLLLEIVDADDLAEEVAWALAHDLNAGRRRTSRPVRGHLDFS